MNILENEKFSNINVPSDVVLSLCEDAKERLWIGTYQNGIFLYENNKLLNFADIINDSIFNASSVWSITEGPEGNIWLGLTQFLVKINKDDFSFTLYQNEIDDPNSLINNTIRSLYWDNQQHLWVGTIKGLSIFSLSKNKFVFNKNLKPLSTNLILAITGSDSNYYVGTNGSGLFIFNSKKELTDSLSSEKNGLVHNVILNVIIDGKGNLWATTPKGISKINTKTLEIENFSTSDGFIGNTFNPRSGNLLSSGYLALGSTRGLSVFHPDSIAYNEMGPPTLLTGLKVLNEEISIDSSILDKPITYTESLSLPPELNALSISYVGLYYGNPKKVIYKYILEGFEEEWRIADKSNTASYTNLKPGNYTFKVIASSGNDFWTENPARVNITILPHWWETALARIVIILLLIGIPLFIIKIRTNTLSKQKTRLESQVKERTLKLEKAYEQLSQFNTQLETKVNERTQKLEKSNSELDRFVYSASHDLGAPLKSISGLLNLAKLDNKKYFSNYLDKIENSIKKLEDVIQNLIQFSRNSRQGVKKEPIDLKIIIKELQEELIYTDSTNVKIDIKCTLEVKEDFTLTTDPVRLKIILSNFISNAIKYRTENGTCKIHLSGYIEGNYHCISVEDNGIGIEKQYLDKIFDMFYRATTYSKGSGLGLYIVKESAEKLNAKVSVKSSINKGSIFTIAFPENS